MRRINVAASLTALLLSACDSSAVNAPRDANASTAAVPIAAPAAQRTASAGAMADVASRIIGRSDRLMASADLADAIDAVNNAIDANDSRALESALRRADGAVDRLAKVSGDDDAADLDAVRLALADARRLLDPAPANAAAAATPRT